MHGVGRNLNVTRGATFHVWSRNLPYLPKQHSVLAAIMVVREDAPDESKVQNHEEFVDAQPEAEPVFTVESILVNILEGIGCV
jgi:hypothetical protein